MNDQQIIKAVLHKIPQELRGDLQYTESNYQTLIVRRLRDVGFQVLEEVEIYYTMADNLRTGRGYIDVLIETREEVFIIEIKSNNNSWGRGINQLRRYLAHFQSEKEVFGILAAYHCGQRIPPPIRYQLFVKPMDYQTLPDYPKRRSDVIAQDQPMLDYVTKHAMFQIASKFNNLFMPPASTYRPSAAKSITTDTEMQEEDRK